MTDTGLLANIQTVLGPIPVEELGRTLMHEHLFVAFPGSELDPVALNFDRSAFVAKAAARLRELREVYGVRSFVDPCPIELGRDVRLMAEIAERSEMNVICTTGFYFEPVGLPFYWRDRTVDEIADFYIHEITLGIGRTGIRAGAIKAATGGNQISATEQKFLEAASIAHRATGVPIITHTEGGIGGPEQHRMFAVYGVAPHHCLIGHCCGNPDPSYHHELAVAGAYVGFDRIGMCRYQTDAVRADNIVHLARSGYGAQILMSQDRFCGWLGKYATKLRPEDVTDEAQRYTYLFTDFLPMLRARGMREDEVLSMLDMNPRRFFSGERPPDRQLWITQGGKGDEDAIRT